MENYFLKIANFLTTKEDLEKFLDELDFVISQIFKNPEISLSQKTKGKIQDWFFESIKEWEEKEFKGKTENELQIFFSEIKEKILKLPQVKVSLAFCPNREFLKNLSLWFEKNFSQKFILDLKVDPKILGGIVFEISGKVFDFSLKRKIKELIEFLKK